LKRLFGHEHDAQRGALPRRPRRGQERNTWNRASENLFSAWIEKLFDDPSAPIQSFSLNANVSVSPKDFIPPQ
jgi:hypothetical protein